MKAACSQDHLKKGLALVERAVAPRSTLPVQGNILLATDQGRLKLCATNLEIAITCWLDAAVELDGAIAVPARVAQLIGELPAGRVDLQLGRQGFNIRCARFDNNLRGINPYEFPLIPVAGDGLVHIAPDALRQVIEQVAFAAATDDSRPILTGVLLHLDSDPARPGVGALTVVASDGFRLAMRTLEIAAPVTPVSVVIPAQALIELGRALKVGGPQLTPQQNPVGLAVIGQQIVFHLDTVELVSQLIDGRYPEYQAILPKQHTTRAVFDRAELVRACKLARVFAREDVNRVVVTLTPGEGSRPAWARVTATSAESGDNAGEVQVRLEGAPIQLTVNVGFLLQVLDVLDTPQLVLEMTTPLAPILIRPFKDEAVQDGYQYVLMPMCEGQ